MNKVNHFRNKIIETYLNGTVNDAIYLGESLLNEHWHNKNFHTKGYMDDLFNLATMLADLDQYHRALPLFADSARLISAQYGETAELAMRLTGLGTCMFEVGMKEPAIFTLGHASAIYLKETGEDSEAYADSLYNLGNANAGMGRHKEALKQHLTALDIRRNLDVRHEITDSLHSLAFIYEKTKNYDKAIEYAKEAMHMCIGDDETYASACNYLAEIYEETKQYEDAILLYDRVLEAAITQTGKEHSAYVNVAYRRANLLAKTNRPKEALSELTDVSNIFQKMNGNSGANHMFYANCLRTMAIIQNHLGETKASESLMLESMKIRIHTEEDLTKELIFLIEMYLANNDPDKALETLIYALMRTSTDNPSFEKIINDLTNAFLKSDLTYVPQIMEAMENLNDAIKLFPIVSKWSEWENEAFD